MFSSRNTNLGPSLRTAKRREDAMSPVDGDDLLEHERKKESTTRTEDSVVNLEKEGELLWLTCLHNLANAEDGGEIGSKNAEDDWLGRKGGRSAHIMG